MNRLAGTQGKNAERAVRTIVQEWVAEGKKNGFDARAIRRAVLEFIYVDAFPSDFSVVENPTVNEFFRLRLRSHDVDWSSPFEMNLMADMATRALLKELDEQFPGWRKG